MFIAALFIIAKVWKRLKCPFSDDKEAVVCMCVCVYIYIYIYNGILLSHKKNNFAIVVTWMDLEDIVPSEISQKDKYYMILLICGI